MASIFTFDPDPPRVSSPWAAATPSPGRSPKHQPHHDLTASPPLDLANEDRPTSEGLAVPAAEYSSITRLEAEPQEGPTEYKLHLLLRRRRSFTRSSTGRHISGSLRRTESSAPIPVNRSISDSGVLSKTPPSLSSSQSRQHRLEQLTTQLLWRLQQSCSYHTSSSTAGVLIHFPDEAQLSAPITPQRLYPGLEESKGALYEIGVADDGELVGLAEDEMEESLNNLRVMAASLGCQVEVQRMVTVGQCEWVDNTGGLQPKTITSRLLVAEAFVRPEQSLVQLETPKASGGKASLSPVDLDIEKRPEQLRVTLTGATMSGKTSLLGTLTTGTFDNGRGTSRLSLLKHRHEIESGVTSSITQELLGYRDLGSETARTAVQVINYGSSDVSSWVDIHASTQSATAGRLVLFSDSAGHPRFRRTTVRGLVGWDPHYTLLCIPADNAEDSSGKIGASPTTKEILGAGAADLDLSKEHLQLCLALELPLVVVITKYDLATRTGLKRVMSKVLSALKEAGRRGCIITDLATSSCEAHLEAISADDLREAEGITRDLEVSPLSVVPIILTSAVKGIGLGKLHALLRALPVPPIPMRQMRDPGILFHIEDSYSSKPVRNRPQDEPVIVAGHLRYGTLTVGDEVMLGPYAMDPGSDESDCASGAQTRRNSPVPTSRSFPGALHKRPTTPALHLRSDTSASSPEWRGVRITSLRNLRLPVRTLHSGQVGTIGIVPVHAPAASPATSRILKGMVLADGDPKAHRMIHVRFTGLSARAALSWTIGSAAVVFFASVRAPSKVLAVTPQPRPPAAKKRAAGISVVAEHDADEGFSFGFGFDEDPRNDPSDGSEADDGPGAAAATVLFQFIAQSAFVEPNVPVLVMPGGGPGLFGGTERGEKGLAGLDGFVGRVVDDPA